MTARSYRGCLDQHPPGFPGLSVAACIVGGLQAAVRERQVLAAAISQRVTAVCSSSASTFCNCAELCSIGRVNTTHIGDLEHAVTAGI
jgi:hypothetical protein